MEFNRTALIDATLDEVWALVDDVLAVAHCIPGVKDPEMTSDTEFNCTLAQQVGSVKANFKLKSRLEIDEAQRIVAVVSEGADRGIASTVKATQRFTLTPTDDGQTSVDIAADVAITGRIATFGHRIIAAKAEQVSVEAIQNVGAMLKERRG
jgi:carbon-monoxide dehydrogenase small subunit